MINILYLIDHIWDSNGGTEGQLLMLMRGLDRQKYNVHLICLKETPWSKTSKVDFPMTVLHLHKLFTPAVIPHIIFFRKYCRKHQIDIIQTYFNDSLIFGVIAGHLAGVKSIIASRRNLGPGFWGRKSLLYAFKWLKGLVTRYMTNSQATKESIVEHEGIEPGKIDVIYNGLDLSRFSMINNGMRAEKRRELGLDDGQVLIGMVAHLRKEKNISLFAEAAHKLSSKYPQARFMVLGEGVHREEIEKDIDRLKLGKIFELPGSIRDIVPHLAAMDIACLTSQGESFSNSVIEYQAAGLPVVATAVGGNVEAVIDKDFLFPIDNLDALVSSLSRLIDDVELRHRIGTEGKLVSQQKYSIEKMVSEHEALYAKCLETS